MNFEVVWLEANTIPNNPFNKTLGLYNQKNIDDYILKATIKWEQILKEDKLKEPIEYFISIVGIDIPPFVFEELGNRNAKLRKVLYLYDRVEGVYQIDSFFKYYDEVFSFDRSDCKQFGLTLLPIYWVPTANEIDCNTYDIFAFASYSVLKPERTDLFRKFKHLAKQNGYKEFIKLYDSSYAKNKTFFIIKNLIKGILGQNALTLQDFCRGLITGYSVMPDQYRKLISCSKVIFDTQAPYQDGLTARFMWALGAGKKIITTNPHVVDYDFFNEEQIYVLSGNNIEVEEFIHTIYTPHPDKLSKILPYRIDNWIKTILRSNPLKIVE